LLKQVAEAEEALEAQPAAGSRGGARLGSGESEEDSLRELLPLGR
jgi:hypothetical protein